MNETRELNAYTQVWYIQRYRYFFVQTELGTVCMVQYNSNFGTWQYGGRCLNRRDGPWKNNIWQNLASWLARSDICVGPFITHRRGLLKTRDLEKWRANNKINIVDGTSVCLTYLSDLSDPQPKRNGSGAHTRIQSNSRSEGNLIRIWP